MEGRSSQVTQTWTWAPAARHGTLASYRMALCVARCPEWQTSPLAYLDGLLAIYSDKIRQSLPGYRTVARIQLSSETPTAVLNVQVGRFAKRFTSICCGLPGITWPGAVWCFFTFWSAFVCFCFKLKMEGNSEICELECLSLCGCKVKDKSWVGIVCLSSYATPVQKPPKWVRSGEDLHA